jgi:hypothetical protein
MKPENSKDERKENLAIQRLFGAGYASLVISPVILFWPSEALAKDSYPRWFAASAFIVLALILFYMARSSLRKKQNKS